MLTQVQIVAWSIGYLSILFVIAYWGDRLKERYFRRIKPIVIGLGVTIYCSAWSFYGTTAQAAENGWYFPPTFLGAILLVVFCSPLLKKLIDESKRTHTTSIADYLAVSYGRSRTLAVLITVVSIALLIPYIALQLKAITESYHLLSSVNNLENVMSESVFGDTAFFVALVLGVFAIAFGTRHLDSREHNNGLMLAIAFESLVKITAFCLLAWYVSSVMFDGVEDIFIQVAQSDSLAKVIEARSESNNGFITALVLGVFATVCLPRQFHVLVVESESSRDFDTVRWLLPLYLIIFGLCMLPLAYAGMLLFEGTSISAEQFVMQLSLESNKDGLALLTYIGGLSAGSSMVIVACVAMATMACNELVVPFLIRSHWVNSDNKQDLSQSIRNIRRGIIFALMLLAYVYYRMLANNSALGAIGLLSFALVAQFAPCLVLSLLLKPGRRAKLAKAVISGIAVGFLLWCYTLLVPAMVRADLISNAVLTLGPFDISWLKPTALFGIDGLNELTHGVGWSLLANIACFAYLAKKPSVLFGEQAWRDNKKISVHQLRTILGRFLGREQADLAINQYPQLKMGEGYANAEELQLVENILSGVIGSVSARDVIAHLYDSGQVDESLIDKTSEIFHFSRELLQESIDNISQGISVVDAQLRLVAWNRRYLEIFQYPENKVHVGRHVADLIRFNAEKNGLAQNQIEAYIEKRLALMAKGSTYTHNYTHHDGRVLEIQGAPMGEGGFVTTFADITSYQEALSALEDARDNLEHRVAERTQQLQQANEQLRQANQNKTHFLAAAGHDLIQPLNAAKLFVAALAQRQLDVDTQQLLQNLDRSLHSADSIISELLAIAKLDSGEMRVNSQTFCVGSLMLSLQQEFSIIAQKNSLLLKTSYSSAGVNTDEKLLRRILQNLLSNAIRYTEKGKVLLGCRRKGAELAIEVWDTGCGIPEDERHNIFTEFHRLNKGRQDGGLGLGLATVKRLCQLLDITIEVSSVEGRGSVFRLVLPRVEQSFHTSAANDEALAKESILSGMKILCIDNEPSVLEAMKAVLEPWGCRVYTTSEEIINLPWQPDVALVDYHLDNGTDGVSLAQELQLKQVKRLPVVVISADQDNKVRAQSKAHGYYFLRKPLKVAALWSVLTRIYEEQSEMRLP